MFGEIENKIFKKKQKRYFKSLHLSMKELAPLCVDPHN